MVKTGIGLGKILPQSENTTEPLYVLKFPFESFFPGFVYQLESGLILVSTKVKQEYYT